MLYSASIPSFIHATSCKFNKENTMGILVNIMLVLVALLHVYFMVLEMFYWERPVGLRAFSLKPEFAKASRTLAANQGLYNGFLAAGLIWGTWLGGAGLAIKVFFLVCIIIAGIFGALTANIKILYIQALPALITLILVWLSTSTN
jgi:putative membrane protein